MTLLEKQLARLRKAPGVYFFKNSRGDVIYVGKATRLSERVRSYFQKNSPARTKRLVKNIASIKTFVTESAIEALILESKLIKRHQPKFNVLMRDDKNYAFVAITKEPFPRLFVTHQPHGDHIRRPAEYLGPFTDAGALREVLRFIRHYFPYCTCPEPHKRLCLNYQLRKCLGLCCVADATGIPHSRADYTRNIAAVRRILKGAGRPLVRELERGIRRAAREEAFERAAKLRDVLAGVNNVMAHRPAHRAALSAEPIRRGNTLSLLKRFAKLSSSPERIEAYDISNTGGKGAVGSMVVFKRGELERASLRRFRIRTKSTPNDTWMLKEVLLRRFRRTGWPEPNLLFIDGGKGQLNAAREALAAAGKTIPIISLGKGKGEVFSTAKKAAVPLASLPQALRLFILHLKDQAHGSAIRYHRKVRRRIMLESNAS